MKNDMKLPASRHKAVHYSGGLTWTGTRGGTVTMLSGWPACVSGDQAFRIRAVGHHTRKRDEVTCRRCLFALSRAIDRIRAEFETSLRTPREGFDL